MFILDFDDTLFDTQAFKQARLDTMRELGVPEEVYWETYKQARNSSDGLFTYSNRRHADALGRQGYDQEKVLQAFQNITDNRLPEFLMSDTVDFLNFLKTFGKPIILLSLGDPSFQELKFKGCGIHDYFDRIFMVDQSKKSILEELFAVIEKDEEVWFVNDKIQETLELAEEYPKMKAVLKVSNQFAKKDYEESGLPFFESLLDIKNYVGKQI